MQGVKMCVPIPNPSLRAIIALVHFGVALRASSRTSSHSSIVIKIWDAATKVRRGLDLADNLIYLLGGISRQLYFIPPPALSQYTQGLSVRELEQTTFKIRNGPPCNDSPLSCWGWILTLAILTQKLVFRLFKLNNFWYHIRVQMRQYFAVCMEVRW